MSRELVLCILVAVYDKIQTAQFTDVAQFGNIESFVEKPFWWKRKIIARKSYVLVTCLNGDPRVASIFGAALLFFLLAEKEFFRSDDEQTHVQIRSLNIFRTHALSSQI